MTTAEKIAVMQAYEDGKTICYDDKEFKKENAFSPIWDWFRIAYFVKPEPKTEMQLFIEKWGNKKIRRPSWKLDKYVVFRNAQNDHNFVGDISLGAVGVYGIGGEWELYKEPSYGPMSPATCPKFPWAVATKEGYDMIVEVCDSGASAKVGIYYWDGLMEHRDHATGKLLRVEL